MPQTAHPNRSGCHRTFSSFISGGSEALPIPSMYASLLKHCADRNADIPRALVRDMCSKNWSVFDSYGSSAHRRFLVTNSSRRWSSLPPNPHWIGLGIGLGRFVWFRRSGAGFADHHILDPLPSQRCLANRQVMSTKLRVGIERESVPGPFSASKRLRYRISTQSDYS